MNLSDNIELCARRALDNPERSAKALQWYAEGRAWIAELATEHGLTPSIIAAVIAALSPQQGWAEQLAWTGRVLKAWSGGKPLPGPGLGANKAKALRILNGEDIDNVLGGDKVRSFFANLTGDEWEVTVDRHALSIAYNGDAPEWITPKRYDLVRTAYREVALRLKQTPAAIQALTWCYWREVKAGRDWLEDSEPF